MKNWAEETTKTIDLKLEGIRDKEIRFFRVEEFKRNISRINSFSGNCNTCQQHKNSIAEIAENIDEAINVPGKTRREYDRLISRISKHIQKEHGFYAPYYFSYIFSFFGIVIGIIIGFILQKIKPNIWIEMISIGFITGLIPAYIWGSIKDKKIRSEKRLM